MEGEDGRSLASRSSSSSASSGSTSYSWSASAAGSRGPVGPVARLAKDSNRFVAVKIRSMMSPSWNWLALPKRGKLHEWNGKINDERYWQYVPA